MLEDIFKLAVEGNIYLNALAVLICVFGCFSSVNILARAQALVLAIALKWLIWAAAVLGLSVWSLHFIAMLAFHAGMPVAYDVKETVASVAIAMVGTFVGLFPWRWLSSRAAKIAAGGVAFALAVSGMHYTGLAAMRFPGTVTISLNIVALSIVVSIVFGVLAFARAGDLGFLSRRIETSAWLALSVISVHWIGMAGLDIMPGPIPKAGHALVGTAALATIVASVSLVILVLALAATLMERNWGRRREQESQRLRRLSNLAPEAMLIYCDGHVLEVNSAGSRLFGMSSEAIIGRSIAQLFAIDDIPALLNGGHRGAEDIRPEAIEIVTAAGQVIAVEISSQPIDFNGRRATAVSLRDMSEHKRDAKLIRHLGHHDTLTDLPNQVLLHQRLGKMLDDAALLGTSVALINFDLRRFKAIDDVFGPAGANTVLIQLAKRLRSELQIADTLARVADDEFVIVLAGQGVPSQVAGLADRLVAALVRPFEIEQQQLIIGTSVGVALYPRDGTTSDALLRAAHTAMQHARGPGGQSPSFFEPEMDAQLNHRRQLEQDLRHAIARGEMALYYQPVANCRTGDVEGFEALMRWKHPVYGIVSPGQFIPLAEETGFIAQLGEWAILTACQTAARWPVPRWVAVNVSPRQFRSSDIPAVTASALKQTGLDPARLEIEITESALIENAGHAISVLEQLRAQGVHVALDDFGTGYSSLSYLRMFKFDKLKIDQSFVAELGQSGDAATIVKAIINLGHNLGLFVTVEGVETPQQLAIVTGLEADHVQGYLLGRPLPMDMPQELSIARTKAILFGALRGVDTAGDLARLAPGQ